MTDRNELKELVKLGYELHNPYAAVSHFESEIATFCGAKFGVATDSNTHAIELSLRYKMAFEKINTGDTIEIPKRTYISIPFTLLKLGLRPVFKAVKWSNYYSLGNLGITDHSMALAPNSYKSGTLHCLSFQFKKQIPIGRGGMILTDDKDTYQWLKKAVCDGRDQGRPWKEQEITSIGYHYYMTPEDAARGLLLFHLNKDKLGFQDKGFQEYPDLSQQPVFN